MTHQAVALSLAYQGTAYRGWQRQSRVVSVQACLEQALSKVANNPIEVICAGRTDAGVHASHQVVSFISIGLLATFDKACSRHACTETTRD